MAYRRITFERDKLYEEIWTDPVQTVARRYRISDVGLAKICKKLLIPIPPRGYWARVAAGQKVLKPRLPKVDGNPTFISNVRIVEETVLSERDQILESQTRQEPGVAVSTDLSAAHPLVLKTYQAMLKKKPEIDGRLHSLKGMLKICVSPENLERAMLIYDSVIKACTLRGHEFEIKDDKDSSVTLVTCMGEPVPIAITEGLAKREHVITPEEARQQAKYPWHHINKWDDYPTGKLTLRIDSYYDEHLRRAWADSKLTKVESKLDAFMEGLKVYAANKIAERHEYERKQAEKARKQARLDELKNLRKLAKEKHARLLRDTRNWHKAERIRAFVEAVRLRRAKDLLGDSPERDEQWEIWAMDQADRIDPLCVTDPSETEISPEEIALEKELNPYRYYW